MHLAEKLKEFFETKEHQEVLPILFVVCDMEEDSIERIIFTKQKIAEAFASTVGTLAQGDSSTKALCQKRVIITVRVTEKFLMIPASTGWEHFYIDELIPL